MKNIPNTNCLCFDSNVGMRGNESEDNFTKATLSSNIFLHHLSWSDLKVISMHMSNLSGKYTGMLNQLMKNMEFFQT